MFDAFCKKILPFFSSLFCFLFCFLFLGWFNLFGYVCKFHFCCAPHHDSCSDGFVCILMVLLVLKDFVILKERPVVYRQEGVLLLKIV